MKRYFFIILMILSSFSLSSCSFRQGAYLRTHPATENWMSRVVSQDSQFTQGADRWFLSGQSNGSELKTAGGIRSIRVANFSSIKANGYFQVQIIGNAKSNSVSVLGPQVGMNAVSAVVHGNTLILTEMPNLAPRYMSRVIIRIGVTHLHQLIQAGPGSIEAIHMNGGDMSLISTGSGNIYLSGAVNLRRVALTGQGSINVLNAQTTAVSLYSAGWGDINISGRVGLRSIVHHSCGNIHLIGADSNGLSIDTDGNGAITIMGQVNLCRLTAKGNTCVYICSVNSNTLSVNADDHADIGLSGNTNELNVNTYQYARFNGHQLCACNAFIRTYDHSHANVTASRSAFASASQSSSIYFFGPSTLLSRFNSGSGIVLLVKENNACTMSSEYRPYSYTMSPSGRLRRVVNYKGE